MTLPTVKRCNWLDILRPKILLTSNSQPIQSDTSYIVEVEGKLKLKVSDLLSLHV